MHLKKYKLQLSLIISIGFVQHKKYQRDLYDKEVLPQVKGYAWRELPPNSEFLYIYIHATYCIHIVHCWELNPCTCWYFFKLTHMFLLFVYLVCCIELFAYALVFKFEFSCSLSINCKWIFLNCIARGDV